MKSHRSERGDIPFEIDILIVVNMFLTGFDAPTLNTLYLDKDLRMHGLIQALSRTNRILNSQKSHGEIVCYRDLREEVDEALRIFGQEQAGQIVLLPGYDECRKEIVEAIKEIEKLGSPKEVLDLRRESDKKTFVQAWTKYLRALNTINTFSTYEQEDEGEARLPDRDIQDYSSTYHDLHEQFGESGNLGGEGSNISNEEGVVFDITLLQTIEVNIDYILDLIGALVNDDADDDERSKMREDIERHIGASASLREKRALINDFVDHIVEQSNPITNVYKDFQAFARARAHEQLDQLADSFGLDIEETEELLNSSLSQGEFLAIGQTVINLKSPDTSIGFSTAKREEWKTGVERGLETIYNELVNIVETVN
jgi:type I restriction enzyme R subunit